MRKPPAIPSRAPSRPIASASTITVVRICRREAPSVRSIPNSLIRWATVIEKVLKIRKEPTKTAMKPKTRRKVCRKPRLSRISSELRSALSCGGLDPHAGRHLGFAIRPFQRPGETPSAAATEIWSKRPRLWVSALRDRQRHLGDAGAAEGGAAELREADQAELFEVPLADQLDRFAELQAGAVGGGLVDRGFGRAAGPVAVEVGERLELPGRVEEMNLGANLLPIFSPSESKKPPGVKIAPAACFTPGVRCICGSSEALTVGTSPLVLLRPGSRR